MIHLRTRANNGKRDRVFGTGMQPFGFRMFIKAIPANLNNLITIKQRNKIQAERDD